MTAACPPTSTTQCTTYTYSSGTGSGSHYRSAVMDASPFAYWRFGDASGSTATDQVTANLGNQNATYSRYPGRPNPPVRIVVSTPLTWREWTTRRLALIVPCWAR